MCCFAKQILSISRSGLLCIFIAACSKNATQVVHSADRPPAVDTRLGPSDIFEVYVYGEPELTSTYRVSSEGSIDFPLIGRIAVKGLTAAQVGEEIRIRLESYIKQPQLSVFVKEMNSQKLSSR